MIGEGDKMKWFGLCSLSAVFLAACGKDTTAPSGPPDLTMKDVVGCWSYSGQCELTCFDREGGYYDMWIDKQGGVYESYGKCRLSGYSAFFTYHLISSYGADRNASGDLPYRRDGDVLRYVNSDGSFGLGVYTQISPDSFTCGTPWKYFSKPAGWDTLIRPLP